jgi:IS4 transposase
MAQHKNNHIRSSLTTLFPARRIRRLARECGAVKRRRKVDIVDLVMCLVLGFASGNQRSLTGIRRAYEKSTRTRIAPSAFYARFSRGLVLLLRELLLDTLKSTADSSAKATGRVLKKFGEVLVVDSTLIRLHSALGASYPAVRTNHTLATAKLCVVMNAVTRGAKSIKITHGRRHDVKTLVIGPWVRKKLLIFDLAYFKGTLFHLIDKHDGFFLCRLKGRVDPFIVESNRRDGRRFEGRTLAEAKARTRSDIVDFNVMMHYDHRRPIKPHRDHRYIRLRVVGVWNEDYEQYHFYLTNIPVWKMKAEHVAAVYAARWEVELLFRELKSQYRLDQIPSKKKNVTEALIYAALLSLAASRRLHLAVRQQLRLDSSRMNFDRWAVLFSSISGDLLELLIGPKRYYRYLERRLTEFIRFEAEDPNVRRKTLVQNAQIGKMGYA